MSGKEIISAALAVNYSDLIAYENAMRSTDTSKIKLPARIEKLVRILNSNYQEALAQARQDLIDKGKDPNSAGADDTTVHVAEQMLNAASDDEMLRASVILDFLLQKTNGNQQFDAVRNKLKIYEGACFAFIDSNPKIDELHQKSEATDSIYTSEEYKQTNQAAISLRNEIREKKANNENTESLESELEKLTSRMKIQENEAAQEKQRIKKEIDDLQEPLYDKHQEIKTEIHDATALVSTIKNESQDYLVYLGQLIHSELKKNHDELFLPYSLPTLSSNLKELHDFEPTDEQGQLNKLPLDNKDNTFRLHDLAEDVSQGKHTSLPDKLKMALVKYDIVHKMHRDIQIAGNETNPAHFRAKIEQISKDLEQNKPALELDRSNVAIRFLKNVTNAIASWFTKKKPFHVKGADFANNAQRLLTTHAPTNTNTTTQPHPKNRKM